MFISLALMLNLLAVSLLPVNLYAAGGSDPGYFVVEKTWKNDTDEAGNPIVENEKRNRPESVKIVIDGSDGSSQEAEIKEADNWKLAMTLPTKDGEGNPITYTAYEEDVPEKYVSSATRDNTITIKQIVTGRDTDEFVVTNEGFANVPQGTVRISKELALSQASKELSDGFAFETNQKVYVDPANSSKFNNVDEVISYKGDLNAYDGTAESENAIDGSIVLTWSEGAEDLKGNKYGVRITISNITIRALAELKGENAKRVAIIRYNPESLCMQSYVEDFTATARENIVGVKADVKIEVLGIPTENYVRVIIDDIDIPDQISYFQSHGTIEGNTFFGLDYPYAESVTVNGYPSSDIYISNGTTYLVYNNSTHKFSSKSNINDSTQDNKFTTMEYLAPANGYSFTWTGSDCGTELFMNAELAEPADYSVSIMNTSSVYKVRYFYQKKGKYDTTPDSSTELRMLAPNTFVEATDEDKTPSAEKPGYVLDTREEYTKAWSGTTSVANSAENPLVLDIYFKEAYVVIYHDNVGDIVWKPEVQTNPELDYGVNTPGYDTDLETEGIQEGKPYRQGYDFLGWSEEPTSETIVIPETVTKNADYWAHWVPGPNKYKVEYYYEVNGKYPSTPDFTSADRAAKTEDLVEVTSEDRIPQKEGYLLNSGMDAEWKGVVLPDGSLVLKVYFKPKPAPAPKVTSYTPPTTGVE